MVSNILSTQAVPNSVVFSASKAFVTYFALALGYELAQENFQRASLLDDNMIDI